MSQERLLTTVLLKRMTALKTDQHLVNVIGKKLLNNLKQNFQFSFKPFECSKPAVNVVFKVTKTAIESTNETFSLTVASNKNTAETL